MLEVDARDYYKKGGFGVFDRLNSKPAILLTGAHHSREFASV